MNYLQKKKLAFMSIVNKVKGFVRTIIGIPPLTLTNCVDEDSVIGYKIYGDSVQDGTPSPDNPVESVSVGEYDAETGKYKIPVKARGKNLIPYPYTETTQEDRGLAWTDNGDGSITVSGVPTGNSQFVLNTIPITGGKQYTLYRIAEPEANINWYWSFFDAAGVKLKEAGVSKKVYTLTAPDDATTIKVLLLRSSVGVETSGTIYPMLLEGAITQADYEPFVEPITTNIYLDEPLGEGQTISYPNDNIPKLPTFKGTTIYEVDTDIQPSNMEVSYYSSQKGE